MMEQSGKAGARFYVNSAHAISRDRVEALFGNAADCRGSIPASNLPPGKIVGRVEIRKWVVERYAGWTGRAAISDERARQILDGFPYDIWKGVKCATEEALAAWVDNAAANRSQGVTKRTRRSDDGRFSGTTQQQQWPVRGFGKKAE